MKYLNMSMLVGLALTGLLVNSASANLYPIAPPYSFVSLDPSNFILSVPQETAGLLDPNPVIGDHLGQHPGAFTNGFPSVDTFFVGLFVRPIATSNPNAAVYLWETTGAAPSSDTFRGPQIEVGYWNGTDFIPYGIPQYAAYADTGVWGPPIYPQITSSITPLSDFGITPEFPILLNAVRIEAHDWTAHNQVTAVAVNLVPEPDILTLIATSFVALLCLGRRRGKNSNAWNLLRLDFALR